MLKIAFFIDMLREHFDGVSITMHQIIKRLPEHNVEAIFFTPCPPEREIPFPVHQVPYMELPVANKGYRYAQPGKMPEMKGILDEFQPDVIHFSSPSHLGAYATKYAKENNILLASIYHTHFQSYFPYYLWFIPYPEYVLNRVARFLLGSYFKCDMILAPTNPTRDYLMEWHNFKPEQVRIWGRGVSTEKFNPSQRDEDFWPAIPKASKKLLFVSRLVEEKEVSTLMRVYKLFEKRRPDVQMIVIGDGPAKKKMVRKMPNAYFSGKLTGTQLAIAYASADVFIFPSITETFGNVVLESMAAGTPVVAAAGGGPIDIIDSGKTGVLVTPKKEEEFYQEITRLFDEPEYYKAISEGGVAYAETQHWDIMVEKFLSHYFALTGKNKD